MVVNNILRHDLIKLHFVKHLTSTTLSNASGALTSILMAPFQIQRIQSRFGSTSCFMRVQPGIILKYPLTFEGHQIDNRWIARINNSFAVERQIYQLLGKHPRIINCFGWQNEVGLPPGLLFTEASHGSLQHYLDNNAISLPLQKKWCKQVVESIVYIHDQGVIHSDLRPDNLLVHATTPTSLDIYLCDFGGSMCEKLGVDGKGLPDSGFFDPNAEWVSTATTDIFSVASILYTILTGHWPYRSTESSMSRDAYNSMVDDLFQKQMFPSDVHALWAGSIIMKCWMNEYTNANDVLQALEEALREC
ncbi:kinase-like protein [Daldinia sp. FL1419]|nr:kinase-like protein [Daldinia sp. FL1419]